MPAAASVPYAAARGCGRGGRRGGADGPPLISHSTLGASVAVFQNGSVTYTYTYGQIRPGGPEVTADTVFQVGSISKMVACIGLLQLMDAKDVSLDDELGDVLG